MTLQSSLHSLLAPMLRYRNGLQFTQRWVQPGYCDRSNRREPEERSVFISY